MYVPNTPCNSDKWTKSSRTYSIQAFGWAAPRGASTNPSKQGQFRTIGQSQILFLPSTECTFTDAPSFYAVRLWSCLQLTLAEQILLPLPDRAGKNCSTWCWKFPPQLKPQRQSIVSLSRHKAHLRSPTLMVLTGPKDAGSVRNAISTRPFILHHDPSHQNTRS